MANVIIPGHQRADGHPFAEFLSDRDSLQRAYNDFVRILAHSFHRDAELNGVEFERRIHTHAEEKRRGQIVLRWYRELRGAGFSYNRTIDECSRALRTELDGGTYTPPERNRLWSPGGFH